MHHWCALVYGALAADFEQAFDPVICYRVMFAN